MTDTLAISLRAMQQDMARLESISMNLANATTPGYKRDIATVRPAGIPAFAETVDALRTHAPADVGAAGGSTLTVRTDDRPGTLKATGQRLDVALSAPGYFEVATESGPAYTRQGQWRLDAQGRLVTALGHPVIGQAGEIVLRHAEPFIDESGQVFDGTPEGPGVEPLARLKVVRFDDPGTLQRIGDGLLLSAQAPAPVDAAEIEVRQGFLENANVNSIQEMVHLIQSMRHFESMQRAAASYDEMLGGAIRKLGEAVS